MTYPVLGAEDGGGGIEDEEERQVTRLTKLLLLVTHDYRQRVHQHLRIHANQSLLLLAGDRERTCGVHNISQENINENIQEFNSNASNCSKRHSFLNFYHGRV